MPCYEAPLKDMLTSYLSLHAVRFMNNYRKNSSQTMEVRLLILMAPELHTPLPPLAAMNSCYMYNTCTLKQKSNQNIEKSELQKFYQKWIWRRAKAAVIWLHTI